MKRGEAVEVLGTFDAVNRAIDESETQPDKHCSVQMDKAVCDAIKAARESGQVAVVTAKLRVKPGPERRIGLGVTVDAK